MQHATRNNDQAHPSHTSTSAQARVQSTHVLCVPWVLLRVAQRVLADGVTGLQARKLGGALVAGTARRLELLDSALACRELGTLRRDLLLEVGQPRFSLLRTATDARQMRYEEDR